MTGKKIEYASFLQRLLAFIIDSIFILIAFHLPLWILAGVFQDALASAILSMMTVTLTSVYLVYFTSVSGQTFGKKIINIKVIDIKTGDPPTIYMSLVREIVGKVISTFIFMFGFLYCIIDYKNRTWHDKMAGTVVIKQS